MNDNLNFDEMKKLFDNRNDNLTTEDKTYLAHQGLLDEKYNRQPYELTAYEVLGDGILNSGKKNKVVTFSSERIDNLIQISEEKKQALESKLKKIVAIATTAGILSLGVFGADIVVHGEDYSTTSEKYKNNQTSEEYKNDQTSVPTIPQIIERTPENFKDIAESVSKRGK